MSAYAIRDKNTGQFVHADNAPWGGDCAADDWYGFTTVSAHAKIYYSLGPAKRKIKDYLKQCEEQLKVFDSGRMALRTGWSRASFMPRELEIVEIDFVVK